MPGDAASVVASLLEFSRDPARHLPRYTAGGHALPGGAHVLRFALDRFPADLSATLPLADRRELREAAIAFIRRASFREGATHYQVLCLGADANAETIKENYHLLMSLIHPDRHGHDSDPWPDDCATRANLAYAVLSDAAQRRDYDATLAARSRARAQRPAPSESRRKAAVPGSLRIAMAVAALAVLVVVVRAWRGDDPVESALLHQWALTGTRDAPAAAAGPRFITPGRLADAAAEERVPREAAVPAPDALGGTRTHAVALPVAAPKAPATPSAAPADEPGPLLEHGATLLAASIDSNAGPADAPTTQSPAIRGQDVELIVARLISYYEAGEADSIMSLVDTGDRERARLRQSYEEFFRATRSRSLRVEGIDWQPSAGGVRAHGAAVLRAEYAGKASLERRVDIDLEIGPGNGTPVITRLALFPGQS